MSSRLKGKRAFVTGAAQGIGDGIARALAAEGARVMVAAREKARVTDLARDIDGLAVSLDVSSEVGWQAASAAVGKHFGALDILVNNAGIQCVKSVEELSLAEWRQVMSTNVEGVFLGCKVMLPHLKRSGSENPAGAAIVNISSIAGIKAFSGQSAYNTSKAAIRHMSKSFAIEFATLKFNVRVNSILPGCIKTPMLESAATAYAEAGVIGSHNLEDVWKFIAAMHPLNKVGRVEDIAAGAVYLASDEAAFITGIDLSIDGGATA